MLMRPQSDTAWDFETAPYDESGTRTPQTNTFVKAEAMPEGETEMPEGSVRVKEELLRHGAPQLPRGRRRVKAEPVEEMAPVVTTIALDEGKVLLTYSLTYLKVYLALLPAGFSLIT